MAEKQDQSQDFLNSDSEFTYSAKNKVQTVPTKGDSFRSHCPSVSCQLPVQLFLEIHGFHRNIYKN